MTPDLETLVRRAEVLVAAPGRRVLGVVGPPGAGKSTLAATLTGAVEARRPGSAVLVPMDGFHLAQAELRRLGREGRKGAPDTFDAAGYVALLQRIRGEVRETVYAPLFDRRLEQPVAGAVPVPPTAGLVVTEGNYLLVDDGAWSGVRPLLDEVWYLQLDDDRRRARLVARHVAHGRVPVDARAWVERSDEANARLVAATRDRADLVVTE